MTGLFVHRPPDSVRFVAVCPCGRLAWWTQTHTGATSPVGAFRIDCPCMPVVQVVAVRGAA